MSNPLISTTIFSPDRQLFIDDPPLEIAWMPAAPTGNSMLVLRDNTYSIIQWDAFTLPELTNFIHIYYKEKRSMLEM